MKARRAGCGESRTSGSEGGPAKPAGGNVRTALRSDPYTYIPVARGFAYLVAIIDWYSRRVFAWRLSNTLDARFCVEALEEALSRHGCPEIFNTHQGSQLTSEDFTEPLLAHGVQVSMDGKGRWLDNVFIERLWRSLKYEEVYLHAYDSLAAARAEIASYFDFFNNERPHEALGYQTPASFLRWASRGRVNVNNWTASATSGLSELSWPAAFFTFRRLPSVASGHIMEMVPSRQATP